MSKIIVTNFLIIFILSCHDVPTKKIETPKSRKCNCGKIENIKDFKNGITLINAGDCYYYVDEFANLIFNDTFYSADQFRGIHATVQFCENDSVKYSIIDTSGKITLNIYKDYELLYVEEEGNYIKFDVKDRDQSTLTGIMSLDGEIIIPPQRYLIPIYRNMAMQDVSNGVVVYDLNTGKRLSDFAGYPGKASEGFGVIMNDRHCFIIDSNGQEVFERYDFIANYSEGLVKVFDEGRVFFLDYTGELAIDFLYEYYGHDNRGFSDGLCSMSIEDESGEGKHGFINKKGKMVIPQIYDETYDFENGYARVVLNDTMRLIDKKGKLIVKSNYKSFRVLDKELYRVMVWNDVKKEWYYKIFDNTNTESNMVFTSISNSCNGRVVGAINDKLVSISLDSLKNNIKMFHKN